MELQYRLCFWYNHLRLETIRILEQYVQNENERDNLDELKSHLHKILPEEERIRINNVNKLVETLEKAELIGENKVELIKMFAEAIKSQPLLDEVEKFKTKCPDSTWAAVKGGVYTTAIHLMTVLSTKEAKGAFVGVALMWIYQRDPTRLESLKPFLDFGAQLLGVHPGSVVFVLKVSSISSLKRLWQSYKDGSLKQKLKQAFNEMKELKDLSQGEEIDVEVTIHEEEYREVLLNLILLEVKGESVKNTKTQRGNSVCCVRDVPEDSSQPSQRIPTLVEGPVKKFESRTKPMNLPLYETKSASSPSSKSSGYRSESSTLVRIKKWPIVRLTSIQTIGD